MSEPKLYAFFSPKADKLMGGQHTDLFFNTEKGVPVGVNYVGYLVGGQPAFRLPAYLVDGKPEPGQEGGRLVRPDYPETYALVGEVGPGKLVPPERSMWAQGAGNYHYALDEWRSRRPVRSVTWQRGAQALGFVRTKLGALAKRLSRA